MSVIKFLYRFVKCSLIQIYVMLAYLFQNKKEIWFNNKELFSELFITHSFGGGTKIFEIDFLKKNNRLLILHNVPGIITTFVCLKDPLSNKKQYFLSNKQDLTFLFSHLNVDIITINSLVSFTTCFNIMDFVIGYKQNMHIFLRYMVHDYHSLCPNFTLTYGQNYCNLKCKTYKCNFSLINNYVKGVTIDNWRKHWDFFLNSMDEIRCFSSSSMEIMKRCYPKIPENFFTIVPHDMSYCSFTPCHIEKSEEVRVGFIGTCDTIPKGKKVVENFIKHLPQNNMKVFIIGKRPIYFKGFRKDLIFHGKYKSGDLQNIISKYKISVIVFPSVWPETFSYLISELMQMELPIICFNYGAQAEKVKQYKKGYIADNFNPNYLYDLINKIYATL